MICPLSFCLTGGLVDCRPLSGDLDVRPKLCSLLMLRLMLTDEAIADALVFGLLRDGFSVISWPTLSTGPLELDLLGIDGLSSLWTRA